MSQEYSILVQFSIFPQLISFQNGKTPFIALRFQRFLPSSCVQGLFLQKAKSVLKQQL